MDDDDALASENLGDIAALMRKTSFMPLLVLPAASDVDPVDIVKAVQSLVPTLKDMAISILDAEKALRSILDTGRTLGLETPGLRKDVDGLMVLRVRFQDCLATFISHSERAECGPAHESAIRLNEIYADLRAVEERTIAASANLQQSITALAAKHGIDIDKPAP